MHGVQVASELAGHVALAFLVTSCFYGWESWRALKAVGNKGWSQFSCLHWRSVIHGEKKIGAAIRAWTCCLAELTVSHWERNL